MKTKVTRFYALMRALLALSIMPLPLLDAVSTPSYDVDPALKVVDVGENFSIDIVYNNGDGTTEIGGGTFGIKYPTTLLSVTGITSPTYDFTDFNLNAELAAFSDLNTDIVSFSFAEFFAPFVTPGSVVATIFFDADSSGMGDFLFAPDDTFAGLRGGWCLSKTSL